MKMWHFLVGCSLNIIVVFSGFAATTTGVINAMLTLTTGCRVNGQINAAGINFGILNFGSSAATFHALNATLSGTAGNGIYVQCTTGQTFNVQVTASNQAPANIYGYVSSAPRYLLLNSDNSQGVSYSLYSDAAFTTLISNNSNLPSSGMSDPNLGENFPIYGRIVSNGFNANLPAGTYTDTINVAVNY